MAMRRENDSTLQYQVRVTKGRAKEGRIMEAMRKCGLEVLPASSQDDILKGIDCHIRINGRLFTTQIKARQSSEDLLFVINEDGKPGKDMKTQAELYAYLVNDTLYFLQTWDVRDVIAELMKTMPRNQKRYRTCFRGVDCELSYQIDPVKGSQKLMAFIHTDMFTIIIDPIIQPMLITLS
jgi:hypothetical protein